VIRRGLWLVAGATIGVSGYRRASRLARSVFPARPGSALAVSAGAPDRPRTPAITGRSLLAAAATAGRGTAQGVAFARDVRAGMAEYLDRQGDEAGRTLDREQGEPQVSRQQPGAPRALAAPDSRRRGVTP
jgi:hypothetical protein